MDYNAIMQGISIWALPVLLAITLHEAAHGWAAKKLGDNTAYMLGRVTMNPLKHIDPFGTILLPALMYFSTAAMGGTPMMLGYAKPVPVNFRNLKDLKWSVIMVALAGPAANVLLAVLSVIAIYVALYVPPYIQEPMLAMAVASIQINIILIAFNLLPILPLDGGRVLNALLPGKLSYSYSRIEPYGFFIILGLMFTGILYQILRPVMNLLLYALSFLLPTIG